MAHCPDPPGIRYQVRLVSGGVLHAVHALCTNFVPDHTKAA